MGGRPVTLNLERMWYRNFKMTAGMVHGYSIPELMERVESGSLRADLQISHRWKLSQIEDAYALFESRRDGALKMLLCNDGPLEPVTFMQQQDQEQVGTASRDPKSGGSSENIPFVASTISVVVSSSSRSRPLVGGEVMSSFCFTSSMHALVRWLICLHGLPFASHPVAESGRVLSAVVSFAPSGRQILLFG